MVLRFELFFHPGIARIASLEIQLCFVAKRRRMRRGLWRARLESIGYRDEPAAAISFGLAFSDAVKRPNLLKF